MNSNETWNNLNLTGNVFISISDLQIIELKNPEII